MENYTKTLNLLEKLFQFKSSSLEKTPIYEILKVKRTELLHYISHQLTFDIQAGRDSRRWFPTTFSINSDDQTRRWWETTVSQENNLERNQTRLEEQAIHFLCLFFKKYYSKGAFHPLFSQNKNKEKHKNGKMDGIQLNWLHEQQYFISNINGEDILVHKNLKKYLKEELDSFLKKEILNIENLTDEGFNQTLKQIFLIDVIQQSAKKIIDFLDEEENLKKAYFFKKKEAAAIHYCLTLDKIPKSYYSEITQNDVQWAAWENLFHLTDLLETPALLQNLKTRNQLLENHPFLVLDTAHFSDDFKKRLLGEFENVEEQINGYLIHGENFQALNFLQEAYKGKVKCIYIDPPYNTGSRSFPYKDSYERSVWLSMMKDRIELAKTLLTDDGFFVANIDEHEQWSLSFLMEKIFGKKNYMGKIVWDKRNPKGDAKGIAIQHEYVMIAAKNYEQHYRNKMWFRRDKENGTKILEKAAALIRKAGEVSDAVRKEFKSWMRQQNFSGGEKAYSHIDDNGEVYRPVSMAWPNKKTAPKEYFIPLVHPITKKECPIPRRGWRNPPQTMQKLLEKGEILFGKNETTQPTRKYLLKNNLVENVPSLLYLAGSDDNFFKNIGLNFINPKPLAEVLYFLQICARDKDSLVLDFFGGSGTTAHAVMVQNQADNGRRKYILIEKDDFFETVTKPRLMKMIYSKNWKDEKPVDRVGESHIFKYILLEN